MNYFTFQDSKKMVDVIISLLPSVVLCVYKWGYKALLIILTSVISSLLFEIIFNKITSKEKLLSDLSSIITGLIFSLSLSIDTKMWQCIIGTFFAIIIVKCLFGGYGCNFVNPANTAFILMIVSFNNQNNNLLCDCCFITLIIGFIYLLIKKDINIYTSLIYVVLYFVINMLFTFDFKYSLNEILSQGFLLISLFKVNDDVTTIKKPKKEVIFAIVLTLLTFIFKYYRLNINGAAFALLIMNLIKPYIEEHI